MGTATKKRTKGGTNRRPTLADVARAAKVSVMTASNVANNRSLVHPKTRERVSAAIEKIGYRPQSHARSLRLARSWTIGMQIVMQKTDFLALPWMGRMVAGLSNTLNQNGYGLLLHSQRADALDDSVLLKLANSDGLITILSGPDDERRKILKKLGKLKQPVIALQETIIPRQSTDLAIVRQDDFDGAVKLATHLLASGCRRLVFLAPDFDWPNMFERSRGLESTVKSIRGASLRVIKCEDDNYGSVESTVVGELKTHGLPDAFVAGNESVALAVLETVERNGYRIPEDVMLTGFNAFDLWFFARKRITTIDFPAYEIGVRAGETMLTRLRTGKFPTRMDVFPAKFLQGVTTTAAPSEEKKRFDRP